MDPNVWLAEGVVYNYTNYNSGQSIGIDVNTTGPSPQTLEVDERFFGTGQIPLGQGDNLADLQAYISGATSAQFGFTATPALMRPLTCP